MDSTIIRGHQDSSGGRGAQKYALGRSLRGFSFKLNAVTEASGKPIFWSLTAGQVPDCLEQEKAVEKGQGKNLIVDKGYDSTKIARALAARGIRPLIPCRSTRIFPRRIDYRVCRRRIEIEGSFHEIKRFRAIATRYGAKAYTFLSLVYVASLET